jgi:hypothetical protein
MDAAEPPKQQAKPGKKKSTTPDPKTFDDKNTVCPPSVVFEWCEFTRKNINKITCNYPCRYDRNKHNKCHAVINFPHNPPTEDPPDHPFGFWDETKPCLKGLHNRECIVKNGYDPNDPRLAGKFVDGDNESSDGSEPIDLSHCLPTLPEHLDFHQLDAELVATNQLADNHQISNASKQIVESPNPESTEGTKQSSPAFSETSDISDESPPKI